MKNTRPYQAIDCNAYDYLEIWAMRAQKVQIQFWDESRQAQEIHQKIQDLVVIDHVEYLVLPDQSKIRLDDLIQIENIPFGEACKLA